MKYHKASASRDADPDTSLATAAESDCWGRAVAVEADGDVIGGMGVDIAAWTSEEERVAVITLEVVVVL